MKRLSIIFCTFLIAAFLCCSCENNDSKETESSVSDVSSVSQATQPPIDETSAPTEEDLRAAELAEQLKTSMPRTDGSTSAIPLEAAIRASLFDITVEEAEKQVIHTTSHDSFSNLLADKCDFVFCHLLSEDQYNESQWSNVSVEQTPISREGFIFLVSRENPVDSLTVEQLKGIYSGKITNWSEVGGDDKPIVAYQRNKDSGSQNYMSVFMDDTPLIDAPTELRPSSMDSIVDVVATYSGESGGIGYSVYSYVGGMYDANGGVKILKVNGVKPEFKSIADGSYPCTGYNYAVIRADEPEGSPARLLLEWILTDKGQRAIASTGYYASLEPASGIEVTIRGLKLLTETGTGNTEASPASWYYYTDLETLPIDYGYGEEYLAVGRNFIFYNTMRPVTGNEVLDAEVEKYLRDETANMISFALPSDENSWEEIPRIDMNYRFSCVNGLLSVEINRGYQYYKGAMWDIESGKQLTLSNLFTNGASFVSQLNDTFQTQIDYVNGFGNPIELIRPFAGLEEGDYNFTLMEAYNPYSNYTFLRKSVYLMLYMNPGENSYFNTAQIFYISPRSLDNFSAAVPRSVSRENERKVYWIYEDGKMFHEIFEGENYNGEYRWFTIEGYDGSERINTEIYDYMKKQFDINALTWSDDMVNKALVIYADLLRGNYGIENPTRDDLHYCRLIIQATPTILGDNYAAVLFSAQTAFDDAIGYGGGICSYKLVIYDLDSGKIVDNSVLYNDENLTGEWYYNLKHIDPPDAPGDPVDIVFASDNVIIYSNSGELIYPTLSIRYSAPSGDYYYFVVDDDCIHWYD